jgi:UDP-N-acetylmuramate dehydrogenase
MGIRDLSIRAIADAVINIRRSKLPDPEEIGNAGSFFKNPSIPKVLYEALKIKYPDIVGYANADGTVKLAVSG